MTRLMSDALVSVIYYCEEKSNEINYLRAVILMQLVAYDTLGSSSRRIDNYLCYLYLKCRLLFPAETILSQRFVTYLGTI